MFQQEGDLLNFRAANESIDSLHKFVKVHENLFRKQDDLIEIKKFSEQFLTFLPIRRGIKKMVYISGVIFDGQFSSYWRSRQQDFQRSYQVLS